MHNLLLDVCYVPGIQLYMPVIINYCGNIERNPSANFVYTGCGGRLPDAASAAAQRRWVSGRRDSIPSEEDIRYSNWNEVMPASRLLQFPRFFLVLGIFSSH